MGKWGVAGDAPANRGGLYRPLSGEYFPRRLDSCCTSRTLALCWSRLPCLRPKALHRPSAKRHARKACVKLHPLGPPGLSSLTSSMPLLRRASEKSFWFFLTGHGISPPALMFIPGLPFGAGPDLSCSGRVEARCVDAASFLPVVTFVPVTR